MLKKNYFHPLAPKDEIAGASRNSGICYIIGSPIAVVDCRSSASMRIYDPTTRDFHMDGIIFPLQEIAAAIALLYSYSHVEEKPRARMSRADVRHRFSETGRNGDREAVHL